MVTPVNMIDLTRRISTPEKDNGMLLTIATRQSFKRQKRKNANNEEKNHLGQNNKAFQATPAKNGTREKHAIHEQRHSPLCL